MTSPKSDLGTKTKKELIDIIDLLKGKLEEMKAVETQQVAQESKMESKAMGYFKDEGGQHFIVKLDYDLESGVGKVVEKERVSKGDFDIAVFQAKKYLTESILYKIAKQRR